MNNKEKLFKLQKSFRTTRSESDFSLLMIEVEKLTSMILNNILAENHIRIPSDKNETITQAALLYMIRKYSDPLFKIDTSFYGLIRIHLIGALFNQEAKKEKIMYLYPPSEMSWLAEGEYIETPPAIQKIERALEMRPDIREDVDKIIDAGRPYETQLYKIKPKSQRLKVKQFMIEMKELIYVADEYL